MQTFLPNADWVRPETWLQGQSWAINKTIIQKNSTLLPQHLLAPFKAHARIDSGTEDDMCRMFVAAAIESIEFFTGLTITPIERQWGVRHWPSGATLQIVGQPVQALKVTDADTGVDISTLCEVNANVEDIAFYLRVPVQYRNVDIIFGSGFYNDAVTGPNIWTTLSAWAILNVWSIPDAVIDEHPLIRLAILTVATDMYENRQSGAEKQHYRIPSVIEHVLRPLHRPPGY